MLILEEPHLDTASTLGDVGQWETAMSEYHPPQSDRPHSLQLVGVQESEADHELDSQPNPSMTTSARAVDLLLRVSHQLRGILASHFAEFDLTDVRYSVLQMIRNAGDGGCSQKQVADELLQSESSISTLIERMRRDGLIYRLTAPRDRRRKSLILSDRGRELLDRVEECHETRMQQLLANLDANDRGHLESVMTRMAASFTEFSKQPVWTAPNESTGTNAA
ncbi:MarR family winged helix-turn-helix transcriptional regulator [Thalassoroseus pseudoceratinae]|uniref:MarR family winged helix-turn-helix transcriptional regulator n=1 Tax=Thalassoroseus pseudoceratinae TaxID=2713176 RepID=UPI001420CEC9|nr:MarR family transcriptional regulator [Thalassoroseus pseudoceratinae]